MVATQTECTERATQYREVLAEGEYERWIERLRGLLMMRTMQVVAVDGAMGPTFSQQLWSALEAEAGTAYGDLTEEQRAAWLAYVDRYWGIVEDYADGV